MAYYIMPAGSSTDPIAIAAGNETAAAKEDERCIISMLWNWNTLNACFLSKKFQIKSAGGMAAMCICVLLIAFILEGLRRAVKEYDRHLVKRHLKKKYGQASLKKGTRGMDISLAAAPTNNPPGYNTNNQQPPAPPVNNEQMDGPSSSSRRRGMAGSSAKMKPVRYRPSFWEQLVRTLLMTVTFILAYILMLLGMYYNGYILICIFLGVFFGIFAFTWGHLGGAGHEHDMPSSMGEITMCCG
ncbi:Ctr copper transporter family-domain-containing protein [Cladorrhinum sp. PSN332]|nr:Ctr copper transporter family-domain-containing protein [Cladorrhinum sp. PSN332]